MVPDGITSYLHQAVPHHSRVSSSAFLHCVYILVSLPFFYHLLVPLSGTQGF